MAVRGYVYFVACAEPDCRKVHPFIKIGQTMRLAERLAALQTGSPVELCVVGYIKTENPRELESYFHKNFNKARIYGEWFRVSSGMIVAIRHHNIINDKFDEFFTAPPKFDIHPMIEAWRDYARELEARIAQLTGVRVQCCPTVSDGKARAYEWGRTER
jgi:hypothetical protein